MKWVCLALRFSLVFMFWITTSQGLDVDSLSPCNDQHLNVSAHIEIFSILEVSDKTQTVTYQMALQMAWKDASLAWSVSDVTNRSLTQKFAPLGVICTPDITLEQSIETYVFPPMDVSLDALLFYDGTVIVYYPHTSQIMCPIDVAHYPFDVQTCEISVWTVAKTTEQVELHLSPYSSFPSEYYNENSEWEFVSGNASREVYEAEDTYTRLLSKNGTMWFNELRFEFVMRRKPLFYVTNIVVPSSLISWVCVLGAFTPAQTNEVRQEKVRLGITTMLSMSIQMMLVSNQMPVTSDSVPVLSMYYSVLIGVISLGTIITSITVQVHHSGQVYGGQVPRWADVLICRWLATVLMMGHVRRAHQPRPSTSRKSSNKVGDTSTGQSPPPREDAKTDQSDQSHSINQTHPNQVHLDQHHQGRSRSTAERTGTPSRGSAGDVHQRYEDKEPAPTQFLTRDLLAAAIAANASGPDGAASRRRDVTSGGVSDVGEVNAWVRLTSVTDRFFLVVFSAIIVGNLLHLTTFREM